ncbi:unnamed protein product, partial [Rotaria sp. Silwood2]
MMVSQRLKSYLHSFNLFQDPNVINNRHQLRNQIISTRIFILFFSIILFSVLIYLLADDFTNSITVETRSLSQYEKLKTQFKDTLQCPCSNLSIPYQAFISLQANMHNVCSLDLNPLIDILFQFTETLTNNYDFRFTAALQFRLLILLCSSVNQIIIANLIDFNATMFNNAFIIEEILLQEEAKEFIDEFIQSITSQFINSLQMIRITNFGSQFMSGVRSNYVINSSKSEGESWYLHIFSAFSQIYSDNCNCSTSFSCNAPSKIYEDNGTYDVVGFQTGCFVLESLLASSLECFYNSLCINQLHQYIPFNTTIFLPSSITFNKTDTIETLLRALMVDEWAVAVNYTSYFEACRIQTCSYSFVGRHPLLFIATTILGLIGGLTKILQIIVPMFVGFIRRKKQVSDASTTIPRILNATQNSSYTVNTTFAEMLTHLMIETWEYRLLHRAYYDACQPFSCTYSYIARREFVHILTMIFGIIGGLSK